MQTHCQSYVQPVDCTNYGKIHGWCNIYNIRGVWILKVRAISARVGRFTKREMQLYR